jgi:hypothetical protein
MNSGGTIEVAQRIAGYGGSSKDAVFNFFQLRPAIFSWLALAESAATSDRLVILTSKNQVAHSCDDLVTKPTENYDPVPPAVIWLASPPRIELSCPEIVFWNPVTIPQYALYQLLPSPRTRSWEPFLNVPEVFSS